MNQTAQTPLLDPSLFVGLDGVAHLCTGGEAPWLRSHDDACRRFGELKSGGMAGRDEMFRVLTRTRQRVGDMLGISAARVAFLSHASEGLNQAVASIDWRPGDNAVVVDLEYPSLVYPIARLRDQGVEPRVVRARDHYIIMDDLAAAVDGRTRLLLVSQISYLTGQRLDLARLAELVRSRGAYLAVDATHALGVAPVDGDLCDFVVSACYKWLLATHGIAVFAYNPDRVGEPAPHVIGWNSVAERGGAADPLALDLRPDAVRYEPGNPSLLGAFVLDDALDHLMPHAPHATLAHAHALGDLLIDGLCARGRKVTTPCPAAERAGNVSFLAADAGDLAARLAERDVLVWGSEGRLRVSTHLYNSTADVTRFFAALDEVAQQR